MAADRPLIGQGRRGQAEDRRTTSIYLTRTQHQALDRMSREQDLSKSQLVRRAVDLLLTKEATGGR